MKKLGTHSKLAHNAKIRAVSTLSQICLSQNRHSFEVGYLGALWFEIQAELDFDPVSTLVDLV